MSGRYKIAQCVIDVRTEAENDVWSQLQRNYEPFQADEDDAPVAVSILIVNGLQVVPADASLIYKDVPEDADMLSLYVYGDADGCLYFRIIQPQDEKERVLLRISADFREAKIWIEESDGPRPWQTGASLTAAIQLAYFFATQASGNLFSHSSCVVKDGKAYLFLGKSGTGKSTHSRMWLQAFADAILLNDDHPIIRIGDDGQATAYGSPWSGKTPCYKNLFAPIGGIVRIRRAPSNSIRRLSPLEAYASVMPSMFNAPFCRQQTDVRHKLLERLICAVPCYDMYCLPDVDAARVCYQGVCK